jgi:hypothetical protein
MESMPRVRIWKESKWAQTEETKVKILTGSKERPQQGAQAGIFDSLQFLSVFYFNGLANVPEFFSMEQ